MREADLDQQRQVVAFVQGRFERVERLRHFVGRRRVLSSQIEGTQSSLQDLLAAEAEVGADAPRDVDEVVNYVRAMNHGAGAIAGASGLDAPCSRNPRRAAAWRPWIATDASFRTYM